MKSVENIRYYIEKTMLENDEFCSSVNIYLAGTKDDRSAQAVLWELSYSVENGMFFVNLDLAEFKQALDSFA